MPPPPSGPSQPAGTPPGNNVDPRRARRLTRLAHLARLLDDRFTLPGTRIRFGYDALIGLVPGVGDFVTAAVAGYIIFEGWRLGLARGVLARMVLNLAIDWLVGSLPVLGDVFDVAYKANLRNLRLMGIHPEGSEPEPHRPDPYHR